LLLLLSLRAFASTTTERTQNVVRVTRKNLSSFD
jgi:hypothetical protein